MFARAACSLFSLVLIVGCSVGAQWSPNPSVPVSLPPSASAMPSPTAGLVSAEEALASVVAFVGDPALTADLAVEGPNQGAMGPFYEVSGTHVSAAVNATSGDVFTLAFMGIVPAASPAPTEHDAIAAAEAFLTQHGISFAGMTRSVEYMGHGETWEYVVKWVMQVNGVTLPDYREVGVDQSGRVWRYAYLSQPSASIPAPQIDQAVAQAAAIAAAYDDPTDVQVESAELHMDAWPDGAQHLTWEVKLVGPIFTSSGQEMMIDHAWVDVDALTGEAIVVGRG